MARRNINGIREISRIIAAEINGRLTYDDTEYTYEMAERQNEDGWTIETPGAMGNIVRTEGVRLTQVALRRAYDSAQTMDPKEVQ